MNTEDTDKSKQKTFGEGALGALVDGDFGKAFQSLVEDVQDTVQHVLNTPVQEYVETGKQYVNTAKKQIQDHVANEAVKHVVNEGKNLVIRHKGAIGLVCLYTVVAYLIFRRR